jgi:predicted amidohydrolase
MTFEAAAQGAQLLLLPECLDFGWTDSSARTEAAEIPGPSSEALQRAAQKHHLYVVAGLVERSGPDLFNTAVLIAPSGEILATHRKINELAIAKPLYRTGRRLQVTPTELGMIGLTICADNAPDSLVLGHALGRMGAEIILSPCAWAVPADYDLDQKPYGALWLEAYRELATTYRIPVVGVSNVGWITDGPWQGYQCIGHSLAIDAQGHTIATLATGSDAEECRIIDVEIMPR